MPVFALGPVGADAVKTAHSCWLAAGARHQGEHLGCPRGRDVVVFGVEDRMTADLASRRMAHCGPPRRLMPRVKVRREPTRACRAHVERGACEPCDVCQSIRPAYSRICDGDSSPPALPQVLAAACRPTPQPLGSRSNQAPVMRSDVARARRLRVHHWRPLYGVGRGRFLRCRKEGEPLWT